jgi:hypothetical protein
MQILISIHCSDPMMAAMQGKALASLLEAGVMDAELTAMNNTFVEMNTFPDEFVHGDYRDEKGNLIHIVNDHVVSATFAIEGAPQTEPNISIAEWESMHGKVTLVAETADDEGDKEQGHGHEHH